MTVNLGIEVGEGWIAETAEIPEQFSSIALIYLVRQAVERYVRLDLAKRMFIDAPPLEIQRSMIDRLSSLLGEQERAVAPGHFSPA